MSLENDITEYLNQQGIDATSPDGAPLFHACFGFMSMRRKIFADRASKTCLKKNAHKYAGIMYLRKNGYTIKEIKQKIGCSDDMVRGTFKRLGDPAPNYKKCLNYGSIKVREEIIRLRNLGMSTKDISEKVGRSLSTINSVTRLKNGYASAKRTTPSDINKIKRLYKAGVKKKDIAIILGWNKNTITFYLVSCPKPKKKVA